MSEIQGIGRFKFHEGNLEEFKRLSAQAIEIARTKDTGTLQYEIYFNDDQSEAIVLERYRDSAAIIEHGSHLGDVGQAILATGLASSELLGEPSDELRGLLAGSPVRLFTPFLPLHTLPVTVDSGPAHMTGLQAVATWSIGERMEDPAPTSSILRNPDQISGCLEQSLTRRHIQR